MKRFMSMLVSLILLVSCFSNAFAAEDFTLRNGIKFGDTKEEVLTKETTLTRESEDSFTFEGKIAGYSGAQCQFCFYNNDGKLTDMVYKFDQDVCTSREIMNDVYKKLYDSLNRQYGTPLGITGGNCYLITGEAFDNYAICSLVSQEYEDCSANYAGYDEWVVDCDGYHVKIDLISYYFGFSKYDLYCYRVDLSYHYYTDEDYEAAVQEKEGEHQEVDDDL